MIVMVFDTETTGVLNRRLPVTHASQPDVVQVGAILRCDETGRVYGELNLIVKPEGRFTVPAEAARVHGITTETAEQFGVPLIIAMAAFNNLAKGADAFVGHNIEFDVGIMTKAYSLVNKPHPFDSKPAICTKDGMDPIMKLPPTERMKQFGHGNKFKAPNLTEAYGFVTNGGTFDGAHDAMADVRATCVVYDWMRRAQAASIAAE